MEVAGVSEFVVRPWTHEEDQFLEDNYPERGAVYCAVQLGRWDWLTKGYDFPATLRSEAATSDCSNLLLLRAFLIFTNCNQV